MGKFSKALKSEIASYEDAEWTGKLGTVELTLTARPLTPADITLIERKHPGFAGSPTLEGMVDLLIHKARDAEDDTKAFDKADKTLLMNVETGKIGEIFGELFGDQMDNLDSDEALDDAVKN